MYGHLQISLKSWPNYGYYKAQKAIDLSTLNFQCSFLAIEARKKRLPAGYQ